MVAFYYPQVQFVLVARRSSRHALRDDAITGLLVNYRNAIGRIAYVLDSEFLQRPVGQYLCKLLKDKQLLNEQLAPFFASDKPYPIWQSDDKATTLAAISPLGGQQLTALASGNPNASSAILELRHRGERIVFAADSEYAQWRDVYRLNGNQTVTCKALTMPHHGGRMQGSSADLQWFCNTATKSDVDLRFAKTLPEVADAAATLPVPDQSVRFWMTLAFKSNGPMSILQGFRN